MGFRGSPEKRILYVLRRYLDHHLPILPHRWKTQFYQILELIAYWPKSQSHYQRHAHTRVEPIQHIVDRVPSSHLVLARTVKRGDANGQLGEHIRGDGRERIGQPSDGVFCVRLLEQCDIKFSQHGVTFETELRIV